MPSSTFVAHTATMLVAVILVAGCADRSGNAEDPAARRPTPPSTTIEPQAPSTAAAPADATITQPAQPTAGPGSSALAHRDWQVHRGGSGADAWYVFEPADPPVAAAPLAIVLHGYGEFDGYDTMHEFIRHTVLGGSIVIYPRWQTGIAAPCAGPFDIEPCMAAAVAGIDGALEFLADHGDRTRPTGNGASYFGFSFGGIITANLANRWDDLDLPEPRVVFLDDPHDGGLNGPGEPSLDTTLDGIPASTLVECHNGADGTISEDPGGACNAVLPKLGHIPVERKAVVMTTTDDHGRPALSSAHGVCTATPGRADAYDWNFCWKVWDDLRSAAGNHELPTAAIGDGAAHTGNGVWSDGRPITPLRITHRSPITPRPRTTGDAG